VRLTISQTSRAECHEIWEPKPPRTLWVTPGLLRDSLSLPINTTLKKEKQKERKLKKEKKRRNFKLNTEKPE
jgi:hypothetical protein